MTGIADRNYMIKFDKNGDLLWAVPNNQSFSGYSETCMLHFHDHHIYFQSGNLSIRKLDTTGQYITTLTADAFDPYTANNGIFFSFDIQKILSKIKLNDRQ